MAITLRAHTSGCIALSASPQIIALPSAVQTGDVIVVSVGMSNNSAVPVMSGAGATWVSYRPNISGDGNLMTFIGYACTPSSTTITLTGNTASFGYIAIGMFSGVLSTSNPVRNEVAASSFSTNGTSSVTPSLTYVAGDLLIGSTWAFAWGSSITNPVWSSGATDNLVDNNTGVNRSPWQDYALPLSGTSTTFSSAFSSGSSSVGAMAISLIPAPTITPTTPSAIPSQAAVRAATYFKRVSGLYIRPRGLIVPRVALLCRD